MRFEAPEADRLEEEMQRFLEWFDGAATTEPVLKAVLAHLWFVTSHPFDDGNGRTARAIADMSLARSEGSSQRFYSMSAQRAEERCLTPASINRTIELLRHMLNWAVGREYLEKTPFRRGTETLIKKLREDNERCRRISEDEEARLLAARSAAAALDAHHRFGHGHAAGRDAGLGGSLVRPKVPLRERAAGASL